MDKTALGQLASLALPRIEAPLDPEFRPAVLANAAFRKLAESGEPCVIGLERNDGTRDRYETVVLPPDHPQVRLNLPYVERIVKFLLWQRGGWRVTIGGPAEIGDYIESCYKGGGSREFDAEIVGETMFERPMEVERCAPDEVEDAVTASVPIGRHLDGCRVGFDLGASDRKVSAVIDGETVFTDEVVWYPRDNSDPDYHYQEIKSAIDSAAKHLPRLDAIGGSSAGVIINNRMMVSSLFRGVAKEEFHRVRDIFVRIGREYGVPMEVANDGDVTALAGSMSLNEGSVLGIAMGSSEAAGYVDTEGNLTGWLNELAFVPIDYSPGAPADEWSGDIGCGVQYLTQQAVFRLCPKVGIDLSGADGLAEKLKTAQQKHEDGHDGARRVWETIGTYGGYAVAHYAEFYEISQVLVLGRVTSGKGGQTIIDQARKVLETEFPDLAESIKVNLPDERTRRIGQAVAAASLPEL